MADLNEIRAKLVAKRGGNSNFAIVREDGTISYHHGAACYATLYGYSGRAQYPDTKKHKIQSLVVDVFNILKNPETPAHNRDTYVIMLQLFSVPFVRKMFPGVRNLKQLLTSPPVFTNEMNHNDVLMALFILRRPQEYQHFYSYRKFRNMGLNRFDSAVLSMFAYGERFSVSTNGHGFMDALDVPLDRFFSYFYGKKELEPCGKATIGNGKTEAAKRWFEGGEWTGYGPTPLLEKIKKTRPENFIKTKTVGDGWGRYQQVDLDDLAEKLKKWKKENGL